MQRENLVQQSVIVVLFMIGLILLSPIVDNNNRAIAGAGLGAQNSARKEEIEATKEYPSGTVGQVVNKAVGKVYPYVDEFLNAEIGAHYKASKTQELFALEASDDNLMNFAERETSWWKNKPDKMSQFVGRAFPAELRYQVLTCTRDSQNLGNECSDIDSEK